MTHTPEAANAQLAVIVNRMKDGSIAPAISKLILARAINGGKPCDGYSLLNRLMVSVALTSDARGFKAWMKVGRCVRKGSKAVRILAPMAHTRTDKETGEKTTYVSGFKAIPVFRLEDTDVLDAAAWAAAQVKEAGEPFDPPDRPLLDAVAAQWGVTITYRGGSTGYFGNTDGKSKIELRTTAASTAYHELAHVADFRLLEAAGKKPVFGQDPLQEAVAELAGCTLAHLLHGDDYSGNAANYLARYSGDLDAVTLAMRVIKRTESVLTLILETADAARVAAAA